MEIQFLIDCNGVKRLATRKIGLKYCFQLIETIIFSMIAGQHATYCTQPTKNALAILRTIRNRCKQTKEKEATIPFLWYKSFWKKKKHFQEIVFILVRRSCLYIHKVHNALIITMAIKHDRSEVFVACVIWKNHFVLARRMV